MFFSILSVTFLSSGVKGHGRLAVPQTRLHTISGYDAYENDPVNFGTSVPATTYHKFACRHDPPTDGNGNLVATPTTVTAGQNMAVQWNLGVNHVGDCAMYASYDYDFAGETGRKDMKWFKIANWKDCQSLNGVEHSIELPSWMPAGRAVLRWDWYALHVHPAIEFYAQCADVTVVGSGSALDISQIPAYTMMGLYPESANNAPGWRQELGLSTPETWMTGPPCACRESDKNGCAYTKDASVTPGFISRPSIDGVLGCGSAFGTVAPSMPPTAPEPTAAPAPTEEGTDCGAEWNKCGGADFDGATCCQAGLVCEVQSVWYSQCVPSGAPTAPVTNPTASPIVAPEPTAEPIEAPTPAPVSPVVSPTSPPVSNPTSPPVDSGCTDPVAPWSKCGGAGYSGSTCCSAGHYCQFQDQWYSQCVPGSDPGSPVTAPTAGPAPVASPTQKPVAPVASPTQKPVAAPVQDPTPQPTPLPTNFVPVTSSPTGGAADIERVLAALRDSDSAGVFLYETPTSQWLESDLYRWVDMIEGVNNMAYTGVGDTKLWVGSGAADAATQVKYGLVNVAAFLSQTMQESIRYNACDENNWSNGAVVAEHGGTVYSATSACGQLHQSYQDYQCTAEEDALLPGDERMACDVDPDMEMRAFTNAQWYGAPAALFCAPKSKVPKAPRWDDAAPWCAQEGGYDFVEKIPYTEFGAYLNYVNSGGSCRDYVGQQSGGWVYCGANGDEACPGSDSTDTFGVGPRTDVEGCCWWGRGAIQSTGTCNYGKLSFYLGKKGADHGRDVIYPDLDFCKNPNLICDPTSPAELKWVAGFFYWLNSVQGYEQGGWNYFDELKAWVDNGMRTGDVNFIDGASGIVNRGCHNPPNCGTGELHAREERRANFRAVLTAMKLM